MTLRIPGYGAAEIKMTSHGDDVQGFDTRWDEVLLSIRKVLQDDVLESLYKMRIRESD